MANYTAADVKRLRELTGSGMMACKNALADADGDFDKAVEQLRIKGAKDVGKRAERTTAEGLVVAKDGVMIEINCETDFVARTPDFKELAHDVAMQVAATNPRYLSGDDIPEADIAELEREFGSRDDAVKAVALLDQPFIKDAKVTVRDLVRDRIARIGENIVVRRFARFEVGADMPEAVGEGDNA